MPKMHEKQMSLGEMIAALRACNPDSDIFFDFGGLHPTDVDSYRGYYDDLAIGFSDDSGSSVKRLLSELEPAVGSTFSGYKGGDFRMHDGTPMWVANYGRCHSTAVVGVRDLGWGVVIDTAHTD